jgi:pseudouridine-5'-phosphate glycosidase
MSDRPSLHPDVADALAEGRPVVALESSVVAQGLPRPFNLETAMAMGETVRSAGALPATAAVIAGELKIGLTDDELTALAETPAVPKLAPRDLAATLRGGGLGATTVAGTLFAAAHAGIKVFATGGIGGVHRGADQSFDISADLPELARRPVAVVASGAKSILDLPATLEVLETWGVPVIGYCCSDFPAFHTRESGLPLAHRVENPAEAASLMRQHWALGQESALLFANPVPQKAEIDPALLAAWIERALAAAASERIAGKAVTPFLLGQLAELSGGKSLAANRSLLLNNARVAAEIACAYAAG